MKKRGGESRGRSAREVEEYLNRPYRIAVVHDTDDHGNEGWVAEVLDLPGCMTQADTLEELGPKIHDAMAGWISVALEDGREIPEPRPRGSYSGRFLLRVPASLHAELAYEAQVEGISLNQFALSALAGAVGWRGEAAMGAVRANGNGNGNAASAEIGEDFGRRTGKRGRR